MRGSGRGGFESCIHPIYGRRADRGSAKPKGARLAASNQSGQYRSPRVRPIGFVFWSQQEHGSEIPSRGAQYTGRGA